ncbi:class B sortase [Lachnospiraceae bacterium OttesenSCG-928-J05]|nr:class B sortase [Lachnospiraceae bacterium OttesenSCG-928-J05]
MKWKELKFLIVLFLVLAFIFFYFASKEQMPYSQAKKEMNQLKSRYVETKQKDVKKDEVEEATTYEIDFAGLQTINQEIIAWIRIPGTSIDYPVLRSGDPEYYLYHNYQKEVDVVGSIFMDSRNSPEFVSAHTILYGHNMITTQMFSELPNYADISYLMKRRIIEVYQPGLYREYEIISAYETSVEAADYQVLFESQEEWDTWLKTSFKRKEDSEKVLTLSTCTNAGGVRERFVVHAKLIREECTENRGF